MSEQHRTKSLSEFKELENIENDQYLIGIDDIDIGNGARIKFDNFVNSCISSDENNKIILGTDNKLYNLSAINLYLEDMIYKTDELVIGKVNGKQGIYKSLQDDNVGNDLSDTDYWQLATDLEPKVSKSCDTMTGSLTIDAYRSTPITLKGTISTSVAGSYQDIQVLNTENNRVGNLRFSNYTGSNQFQINLMKYGTNTPVSVLVLQVDEDGKKIYSPVQLITTYANGTSGYNIWSNGYCEQWGRITLNGKISATNVRVSFLKKFTNVSYFYETNQDANAGGGNRVTCGWQAVDGMSVGFDTTAGTNGTVCWRACGYLASDQY